jgi:hypothetical protein
MKRAGDNGNLSVASDSLNDSVTCIGDVNVPDGIDGYAARRVEACTGRCLCRSRIEALADRQARKRRYLAVSCYRSDSACIGHED